MARALRAADAVLLIAYTLLLAVLLLVAIHFALTADPSHCTAKNSVDAGVGIKFAVLAVASFAVGRIIGYFRRMIHKAPYKIPKRVSGHVSPVVMYARAVAITDLVLTHRRGKHPVGYYINEFVIDHPFLASILALVVGAMIAHFFLNIADCASGTRG